MKIFANDVNFLLGVAYIRTINYRQKDVFILLLI